MFDSACSIFWEESGVVANNIQGREHAVNFTDTLHALKTCVGPYIIYTGTAA